MMMAFTFQKRLQKISVALCVFNVSFRPPLVADNAEDSLKDKKRKEKKREDASKGGQQQQQQQRYHSQHCYPLLRYRLHPLLLLLLLLNVLPRWQAVFLVGHSTQRGERTLNCLPNSVCVSRGAERRREQCPRYLELDLKTSTGAGEQAGGEKLGQVVKRVWVCVFCSACPLRDKEWKSAKSQWMSESLSWSWWW